MTDPYAIIVLVGLAVAILAAIVDLIGRAVTRRRHRRAPAVEPHRRETWSRAGRAAIGASMLGCEPTRRQ